jgi:hypothetical protein
MYRGVKGRLYVQGCLRATLCTGVFKGDFMYRGVKTYKHFVIGFCDCLKT